MRRKTQVKETGPETLAPRPAFGGEHESENARDQESRGNGKKYVARSDIEVALFPLAGPFIPHKVIDKNDAHLQGKNDPFDKPRPEEDP